VDGGFGLAGFTESYGVGYTDFWLVKTDANGQPEWNHTFGGIDVEEAYSVIQTVDGGYALVGYTSSYGTGSNDMWLVKTDPNGQIEWSQTFGGFAGESAYSVIQTSDGEFVLAGGTASYGAGQGDIWIIKFKPLEPTISLNSPNNNTIQKTMTVIDLSVMENIAEVSHVWYIWDNNGTIFSLSDPYDIDLIGPETQHLLTVYANDTLGKLATLRLVFTTDDTPPTFTITGIEEPIRETKTITVTPSDENGVDKVEIWLNETILTTLSSEPYQYTLNVNEHESGAYNLTVRVTDVAGNSNQESYMITISNEQPGISPEELALIVLGISSVALVTTIVIVVIRRKKSIREL
jgi:hypothetical protein